MWSSWVRQITRAACLCSWVSAWCRRAQNGCLFVRTQGLQEHAQAHASVDEGFLRCIHIDEHSQPCEQCTLPPTEDAAASYELTGDKGTLLCVYLRSQKAGVQLALARVGNVALSSHFSLSLSY